MRREVIASYPFMVSQARFFDGQNRSFHTAHNSPLPSWLLWCLYSTQGKRDNSYADPGTVVPPRDRKPLVYYYVCVWLLLPLLAADFGGFSHGLWRLSLSSDSGGIQSLYEPSCVYSQ